jgi:hypothetical protein
MGTESPMAAGYKAGYASSYDDDDIQTDTSTHGDSGKSFCIELQVELDPNYSTTIRHDALASDRDSAHPRLDFLATTPSSSSDMLALGVVTNHDKKGLCPWPNGHTLTVCFFDGSTTLQREVQNCASQWMQYANIKFSFIPGTSADIRIAFTGRGGPSYSHVGTGNLAVKDHRHPTMKLGLDDSSPSLEIQQVTLHEFGHVLGCVHEHSQPNCTLGWNRTAVIADHTRILDKKIVEPWVEHNIFKKYNPQEVKATAFDRHSIMLYPISESWTYNRFSSEWNNHLSDKDKIFISEIYPFLTQPPPIPTTPIVVVPMTYLPPHASSSDIAAIKWSDSPSKPSIASFQIVLNPLRI